LPGIGTLTGMEVDTKMIIRTLISPEEWNMEPLSNFFRIPSRIHSC
jgi:hypothetical protein